MVPFLITPFLINIIKVPDLRPAKFKGLYFTYIFFYIQLFLPNKIWDQLFFNDYLLTMMSIEVLLSHLIQQMFN